MRSLLLKGFFQTVSEWLRRGKLVDRGWDDPFTAEDLDLSIPTKYYAYAEVPKIPSPAWATGTDQTIPTLYWSAIEAEPEDTLPTLSTRSIVWEVNSTGGVGLCKCVVRTPQYVIASGEDAETAVVLVLDPPTGDELFRYEYDGSAGEYDIINHVVETEDGGFACCGVSNAVVGDELGRDVSGPNGIVIKLPAPVVGEEWVADWVFEYTPPAGTVRLATIIEAETGIYVVAGQRGDVGVTKKQAFLLGVDNANPIETYMDRLYIPNPAMVNIKTTWLTGLIKVAGGYVTGGTGYDDFDGTLYGGIYLAWLDSNFDIIHDLNSYDPGESGETRNFECRGISLVEKDNLIAFSGFYTEQGVYDSQSTRQAFVWKVPTTYDGAYGEFNLYGEPSPAHDLASNVRMYGTEDAFVGYTMITVDGAKDVWLAELRDGELVNSSIFESDENDWCFGMAAFDRVNPQHGFFIGGQKNLDFFVRFVR